MTDDELRSAIAAPPHPRGSTRGAAAGLIRLRGSPAPAGIDPGQGVPRIVSERLPRTRGDRPDRLAWSARVRLAPPHPRGSTPSRGRNGIIARGSPAPAGIDPDFHFGRPPAARLPRTRGDRPDIRAALPISAVAPPHPRGSTPAASHLGLPRRGSPAPAGIDPDAAVKARFQVWLPRTRGDRPNGSYVSIVGVSAPPHPRGSTPMSGSVNPLVQGSPAPAGIDPSDAHGHAVSLGLPRTRGDRPDPRYRPAPAPGAPPHPRGSTLDLSAASCHRAGSPAPAGIDPIPWRAAAASRRLPRTRGDRPASFEISRRSAMAPPHPRGSTRDPGKGPRRRSGLPRTRGDRPMFKSVGDPLSVAPPHPRGSTPDA